MIKSSPFTQQMIDLQKTSFLNLCKAVTTVQKQASSAMDFMLNQAPWIPSESRHFISGWLDTCRQESDRFETYVEESYTNLGIYFSPKAPAKTAKSSATKAKKVSTAKPKKAAAAPAKKATPAVMKKAAPVEPPPAKVIPVKKAATNGPQKPIAAPAGKAAPAVNEKATPLGARPDKAMPDKEAEAPTKESKPVLK